MERNDRKVKKQTNSESERLYKAKITRITLFRICDMNNIITIKMVAKDNRQTGNTRVRFGLGLSTRNNQCALYGEKNQKYKIMSEILGLFNTPDYTVFL